MSLREDVEQLVRHSSLLPGAKSLGIKTVLRDCGERVVVRNEFRFEGATHGNEVSISDIDLSNGNAAACRIDDCFQVAIDHALNLVNGVA